MRGVMQVALVPMLALVFAGCIEYNPPSAVPASFHSETAAQEARAWDPAARLLRVGSVEARQFAEAGEFWDGPTRRMFMRADPAPGDGRAPAWFYEYAPADGAEALMVLFAGSGMLTRQVERSGNGHIEAWNVDSDVAAAVALASVPDWIAHRDSPRLEVGNALLPGHLGAGPTWVWLATDHQDGWTATRIVNAATGQLRT